MGGVCVIIAMRARSLTGGRPDTESISGNTELDLMINTILVPTDGSEHAQKAIDLAVDIAGKYGARMIILHALLRHTSASEIKALSDQISIPEPLMKKLQMLEESLLDAATAAYDAVPIALPVPADILQDIGDLIVEKARETAEARGIKDVAVQVVDASPAGSILAAADHEKADMIVMGSRGLSNIGGMLMGSVSHKVSHLAACTCVTVK